MKFGMSFWSGRGGDSYILKCAISVFYLSIFFYLYVTNDVRPSMVMNLATPNLSINSSTFWHRIGNTWVPSARIHAHTHT